MRRVFALLLLAFVFAGLAGVPVALGHGDDDCSVGAEECASSNSGPGGGDDRDDDPDSADDDPDPDDNDDDDPDSSGEGNGSTSSASSSTGDGSIGETSSVASLSAAAGSANYAAPAGPSGEVVISDDSFTPATYTIVAGGTVNWLQQGDRPHTVTADDGSFDSGILAAGQLFSRKFDTPGTFAYFCELHGGAGGKGMAGKIVVTAAGAPPGASAAGASPATNQSAGQVGASGARRGAADSSALPKTGMAVGGLVLAAGAAMAAGLFFKRKGRKA